MASSSTLYRRLESLRKTQQEKKNRLNAVNAVYRDLTRNYDDDISDFNSYLNMVNSGLSQGLYNNRKVSSNCDLVNTYRQKNDYADTHISSAESSLRAEISKLNNEISNLDSEISRTQRAYWDALEEEREAARRAAEAARRAREMASGN
jgi:membrane-associated HD superfamily phosphohydrolase